jgi:hypothetical protein
MIIAEAIVAGIRSMRPAVPSRDYGESRRFYSELGFQLTDFGPNLAEARLGAHSFLLQDFYVAEYAKNFVMHMLVESVDDWWAMIEPLALDRQFRVRSPRPPKLESWGLRVLCVFDPSDVLWQIASRPTV